MTTRDLIFRDIDRERSLQDARWGGPAHDDQHTVSDWIALLTRHAGLAASDGIQAPDLERYRRQLVRVAAWAVAAMEALDRQAQREGEARLPRARTGY